MIRKRAEDILKGDQMQKAGKAVDFHRNVHRRLLATVSVLALAVSTTKAAAEDPTVWITIGGGLQQISASEQPWTPGFIAGPDAGPFAGSFPSIQKSPRLGYEVDTAISLQLPDSDWKFSASLRYGKAAHSDTRNKHQNITAYVSGLYGTNYDASTRTGESNKLLDFTVGRDVGIGLFDGRGHSTLSAGVRIAQLHSTTDYHASSAFFVTYNSFNTNEPDVRISRKFRGVGPLVAWDATTPLASNPEYGELAMDWGINATLLFGRQTVIQTTDGAYHQRSRVSYPTPSGNSYLKHVNHAQYATGVTLRRTNKTVPTLGAYLAATYRLPSAKFSLGYRADLFFGAIDGGAGSRQETDRGFFGPYASFSIGLP